VLSVHTITATTVADFSDLDGCLIEQDPDLNVVVFYSANRIARASACEPACLQAYPAAVRMADTISRISTSPFTTRMRSGRALSPDLIYYGPSFWWTVGDHFKSDFKKRLIQAFGQRYQLGSHSSSRRRIRELARHHRGRTASVRGCAASLVNLASVAM
jgi:hypothetical protein